MKYFKSLFLVLLLTGALGKEVFSSHLLTGRLECVFLEDLGTSNKYRATLTLYSDFTANFTDSSFLLTIHDNKDKNLQQVVEVGLTSTIHDSILIAVNQYFRYTKHIYTAEFTFSGSDCYLRQTRCCRAGISNLIEDEGLSLYADIPSDINKTRITTENAPSIIYRPLMPFSLSLQEASPSPITHTYRFSLPAAGGSQIDPMPQPGPKNDRMEYGIFSNNYNVQSPLGNHIPHKFDSSSGMLDVGAGLQAGVYVIPYYIIRTGHNLIDTLYREVVIYIGNYVPSYKPSLQIYPVNPNHNIFHLNWKVNYSDSFSRIDLMVKTDAANWLELRDSVDANGSYFYTVNTNGLYQYRLKGYHISGEIRYSNTESASLNVGTDEWIKESTAFYPNPGNGYFYTDLKEISSVEITDISGKKSEKVLVENGKLDLSLFPEGVYVLRFHSDEKEFYQKVILLR